MSSDKKLVLLYSYNQNGPGKVIKNLKLGLNDLGISYFENPGDLKDNDYVISLQNHTLTNRANPNNLLIGPNVCTLPIDDQFIMSLNYKKCIVPSQLVLENYSKWIPLEKLFSWPVGIDTNYFSDRSDLEKSFDCLIYFKRRGEEELEFVKSLLGKYNQSYNVIRYGNYNENEFLNLISRSKYCFVIDNTESQGIAIQEMMSCNLPLFVWDLAMWADRGPEYSCKATSIPYWDERCGSFQIEKNLIENSFIEFLENFSSFRPRDYILENLTLKDQAYKILRCFDSFI